MNAYDHGLSFKSLSRATPCISGLKKLILLPMVENKNICLAMSLFCLHIGEEYFHWPIKNNQPMRTSLANSSCCCYVNKPNQRYGKPCKKSGCRLLVSFLPTRLYFSHVKLYSGPFGGPITKWGQRLYFSPVRLYSGTFGGLITKWGQKLHLSSVSLYSATMW